jgi:hypothetical protein
VRAIYQNDKYTIETKRNHPLRPPDDLGSLRAMAMMMMKKKGSKRHWDVRV